MWSNVCFISSLFSTNWNSVTHSLFILPLLSRLCKCTTATFQLFSFPQVVLPRHFHFQTSPLCLCHTTTFTFYFCTGWGGVTLRGNCQIWREPQRSHQHECEWFEDVNLKNANGPTFWSVVRLGLLLHCLILLMGCKDCKLSFMSPLHMPTVTGQHQHSFAWVSNGIWANTIRRERLRSHTDEVVYPAPAPPRKYVIHDHTLKTQHFMLHTLIPKGPFPF